MSFLRRATGFTHDSQKFVCPLPRIIESSLATILCARLGGDEEKEDKEDKEEEDSSKHIILEMRLKKNIENFLNSFPLYPLYPLFPSRIFLKEYNNNNNNK